MLLRARCANLVHLLCARSEAHSEERPEQELDVADGLAGYAEYAVTQ